MAPPPIPDLVMPSEESVRAGADALIGARVPVVVAGRGAVLAGAGPAIERLAERLGALLATSANGHGLFAMSP